MEVAYILLRNRQLIWRERIFRDRNNPLDYINDMDIIDKFRLPRHVIVNLCDQLNIPWEHPTKRSHALPTPLQVMTALRFYTSGSFHAITGDLRSAGTASDWLCAEYWRFTWD